MYRLVLNMRFIAFSKLLTRSLSAGVARKGQKQAYPSLSLKQPTKGDFEKTFVHRSAERDRHQ